MPEQQLQGEVAVGLNPHYRPPIMRWNRVELVAEPGHSFGIRHDEGGVLTILVKPPGKDWPFGMEPTAGGVNTIDEGARSYEVWNDERGTVRDHDSEPVDGDVSRCRICEERAVAELAVHKLSCEKCGGLDPCATPAHCEEAQMLRKKARVA